MSLRYMFPAPADHYAADVRLGHPKSLRKFALGNDSTQTSNFCDVVRAKFAHSVKVTFARNAKTSPIGVLRVFLRRDPFQVLDAIIQLVAILVVNLRKVIRIWNERLRDHAVNKASNLPPINIKNGSIVPAASRPAEFENADHQGAGRQFAVLFGPACATPGDVTNAPQIRDFIKSNKPNGGLPCLAHPNLQREYALGGTSLISKREG